VTPATKSQLGGELPLLDKVAEDLASRNAKFVISEVIPFDVRPPDESETGRRHWIHSSADGEPSILLGISSKAVIKYVVMRRPRFGNESCRTTSTDSFRKQKSTKQIISLLRYFDVHDDGTR
jgi:hypothetical protein